MTIPNVLKYTFILEFIVGMAYGFLFFLSPEFFVDSTGWPFLDPVAGRIMGSLFIGFGAAALFGYRAASWDEVKIVVLANIVWGIFGVISMFWMMIAHPTIPIVGWFNTGMICLFTVLFVYSYYVATR